MTRFDELHALFEEARHLATEERARFLDEACGDDAGLREELEQLLEHHDSPRPILSERSESEPEHPLPSSIGEFHIKRVLGQGGMGVVYLATQPREPRTVALKVLRSTASHAISDRFRHEIRLLGRLRHPCIASIYQAGLFESAGGEEPYFAMEYVEGVPLDEYVEKSLDLEERLRLFSQLCEGVAHAHQLGIVHRDLKPANILIPSSETGASTVKILDFGIAVTADTDLDLTRLTQTGQWIGTLGYLSPEQMSGERDAVDTRADVYSLGVILYELIAGKSPYRLGELSPPQAVRLLREQDPEPLPSDLGLRSKELACVVRKAMHRNPDKRYSSANELLLEISRVRDGLPVEAPGLARMDVAARWAARHRALISASVVLVLSLTIATGWIHHSMGIAEARAAEARDAQQRASEATKRAVSQTERADFRTSSALGLADGRLLRLLREEAELFWPAREALIPQFEGWIPRATELVQRLPTHQGFLARLHDREPEQDPDEEVALQWLEDQLTQLVGDLTAFSSDHPLDGTLASVRSRLQSAQTLEDQTLIEPEQAWEDAIDEIWLTEQYDELELSPQLGLIPLEPDPESGLGEFWHPESGTSPVRDPTTGRWIIDEDTSLVFVLLPGGLVKIGAQNIDLEGPYAATELWMAEYPLTELELAPFFISKFEMTRGQWFRLARQEHASESAILEEVEAPLTQPAHLMSYYEALATLTRYELTLPTEEQWEYAARGGTTTRHWFGSPQDAREPVAENFRDQSILGFNQFAQNAPYQDWNDGFAGLAPVGRYRANPYGLHDVMGNLSEWCRERAPYSEEDPNPVNRLQHVRRGGSFHERADNTSSSVRTPVPPTDRSGRLGLRPIREVMH